MLPILGQEGGEGGGEKEEKVVYCTAKGEKGGGGGVQLLHQGRLARPLCQQQGSTDNHRYETQNTQIHKSQIRQTQITNTPNKTIVGVG